MTAFETTMTVPTAHVRQLMERLSRAGFTLLDTGERVTNDDGLEAEATLRLVHFGEVQLDADVPLGVPL